MKCDDYIKKYCLLRQGGVYTKNGEAYICHCLYSFDTNPLILFLAHNEITEIYSFHDFRKTQKSNVACCGFSKKEQRWYGWTHRGVRSFGIGDTYFNYLGGKPAKTLEECKKLAFYAVQELN